MKLYVKDLLGAATVLDEALVKLAPDNHLSFEESGAVFSTQPVVNGTNALLIAAKLKYPELFKE
ncbi:hypothetical protein K6U27_04610 [Vibrio fluvialis]|uniref:hypothetical protein n=1 Tax=Vibrio fluvialis TaxID=676 RepID=UPI001EE9B250|nr:hypothetical protein [Vibrio fluvialis]MCG6371978.1 hypothetical protein [Vibrio fluvialis]